MAVVSTLYPPQVATFMPAFVCTEDAEITFSISQYNEVSAIKRVHISCVNQTNNENALSSLSGIIIQTLGESDNGVYTVKVPVKSLSGSSNQFNINQFYKVQLRFDSYDGTVPKEDSTEFLSYLLDYQDYFSEWSSVCLIRPILQPQIYLRSFDTNTTGEDLTFHKGIIPINGKVLFDDDENSLETETLQSYVIQIISNESKEVVYETSRIYTGDNLNQNNISYRLDLQNANLGDDFEFIFKIIALTTNQYQFSKEYTFKIANYIDVDGFNPTVEVDMDNENGVATLTIDNSTTTDSLFGTLYIKRASSVDHFSSWETICETKLHGTLNNLIIEDKTVGSFIWYRYSVQFENSKGAMTDLIRTKVFLPKFYSAFITRGDQQLALRYNLKITNFKPVVNRTKIDTLGGQYPKFAENAILNYRQFSFTATISAEDDFNQMFITKRSYFGDEYDNYQVYLDDEDVLSIVRNDTEAIGDVEHLDATHLTTTLDDWFWEREFRTEVLKWLNDGEPKLFRSMTEGIIPVMITDVSMSPKEDLGRRLWDISATAYEVADGTSLETLGELGIIDIPTVDSLTGDADDNNDDDYVEVTKIGQIYQQKVSALKSNIITASIGPEIAEKYAGVNAANSPSGFYLKNIKIYFHNSPNLFLQTSTGLMYVNKNTLATLSETQRSQLQLGYSFDVATKDSVGTTKIFVNQNGYYQLPQNMDVTEISFPQTDDIVTVDYLVIYKEYPSNTSIISGTSIQDNIVGQYSGVFSPNEYLGDTIRAKYNYIKADEYYQLMQFWEGICLDVTPYAVAHIKYKGETTYNDYLVGATGVLHMQDDYEVLDMCFLGRRLVNASLEQTGVIYTLDSSGKTYSSVDEITRPKSDYVYKVGSGYRIYYKGDWHVFYKKNNGTVVLTPEEKSSMMNEWNYVVDSTRYSSTKDIDPVPNCVYSINSQNKIYYQDQWYSFTDSGDGTGIAAVPIEGMINYKGQILRNTY